MIHVKIKSFCFVKKGQNLKTSSTSGVGIKVSRALFRMGQLTHLKCVNICYPDFLIIEKVYKNIIIKCRIFV